MASKYSHSVETTVLEAMLRVARARGEGGGIEGVFIITMVNS